MNDRHAYLRWRPLIAPLVVGVLFRVVLIACVAYRIDTGDASGYLAIARNLLDHGVFSLDAGSHPSPTMMRPPLYPFFLAAKLAALGTNPVGTQVLQGLLGLVIPLALHSVAKVHWPRQAPAVLWATMLSPFDVLYAGAHLSETLCTTLLVAGLSLPATRPQDVRAWCLGGACLGLCVLTRDVYLPVVLGLAVIAWTFEACRFGAKRAYPVALILFAMGTVAPWSVRNVVVMHSAAPVSKGLLGFNLWAGTWEHDGAWVSQRGADMRLYPDEAYRGDIDRARVAELMARPLPDQDHGFMALALERIREAPLQTLLRYTSRVPGTWLGTRSELFTFWPRAFAPGRAAWYLLKLTLYGLNFIVVALGFAGLVWQCRRHRGAWWFALPVLANGAVYFPMHNSESRYTQPVLPLLVLFAVFAGSALVERFVRVRARRRSTSDLADV